MSVEAFPEATAALSRRALIRNAALLSALPVVQLPLELLGGEARETIDTSSDVAGTYYRETTQMPEFVTWASVVSHANADGTRTNSVEDDPDASRRAGSVNKLAAALAVLEYRDQGLLDLHQSVTVPDYAPDPGAKRQLKATETIDSLLTKMIVDSSNEAFRALLTVVPGETINAILRQKGFYGTYLEPSDTPGRFFTGRTTPRSAHDLLLGIANGNLLSSQSSGHLLNLMARSTFNLGVKRHMDNWQRQRVANKYGQLKDTWNEVGILFADTPSGRIPHTVYSFFARTLGSAPSLPTVENAVNGFNKLRANAVHATLGRTMMNSVGQSLALQANRQL